MNQDFQYTPLASVLMYSCVDDSDVTQLLLDAGASPYVHIGDCTSILQVALTGALPHSNAAFVGRLLDRHPELVNMADIKGWTPLHYCAQCITPSIAQMLIDRGAEVNAPDSRGQTAMTILLSQESSDLGESLYDLLKANGARCSEISGQMTQASPINLPALPQKQTHAPEIRLEPANEENMLDSVRSSDDSSTQTLVGQIYCYCHQPAHGEMVPCFNPGCGEELFHLNCTDLEALPGEHETWFCAVCRSEPAPKHETEQELRGDAASNKTLAARRARAALESMAARRASEVRDPNSESINPQTSDEPKSTTTAGNTPDELATASHADSAVMAIKNRLRALNPHMSELDLTALAAEELKHQLRSSDHVVKCQRCGCDGSLQELPNLCTGCRTDLRDTYARMKAAPEKTPYRLRCYDCPYEWTSAEGYNGCPRCDSRFVDIVAAVQPSAAIEHSDAAPDVPESSIQIPKRSATASSGSSLEARSLNFTGPETLEPSNLVANDGDGGESALSNTASQKTNHVSPEATGESASAQPGERIKEIAGAGPKEALQNLTLDDILLWLSTPGPQERDKQISSLFDEDGQELAMLRQRCYQALQQRKRGHGDWNEEIRPKMDLLQTLLEEGIRRDQGVSSKEGFEQGSTEDPPAQSSRAHHTHQSDGNESLKSASDVAAYTGDDEHSEALAADTGAYATAPMQDRNEEAQSATIVLDPLSFLTAMTTGSLTQIAELIEYLASRHRQRTNTTALIEGLELIHQETHHLANLVEKKLEEHVSHSNAQDRGNLENEPDQPHARVEAKLLRFGDNLGPLTSKIQKLCADIRVANNQRVRASQTAPIWKWQRAIIRKEMLETYERIEHLRSDLAGSLVLSSSVEELDKRLGWTENPPEKSSPQDSENVDEDVGVQPSTEARVPAKSKAASDIPSSKNGPSAGLSNETLDLAQDTAEAIVEQALPRLSSINTSMRWAEIRSLLDLGEDKLQAAQAYLDRRLSRNPADLNGKAALAIFNAVLSHDLWREKATYDRERDDRASHVLVRQLDQLCRLNGDEADTQRQHLLGGRQAGGVPQTQSDAEHTQAVDLRHSSDKKSGLEQEMVVTAAKAEEEEQDPRSWSRPRRNEEEDENDLREHSQEMPYVCTTCNKRFKRLHDLKRHARLHTGERAHTCDKCGRQFARGDTLARHNKRCTERQSSQGGEENNSGGEHDNRTNEHDEQERGRRSFSRRERREALTWR